MDPQQDDFDTTNPDVSRRRFIGGCSAVLAAGLATGLSGVAREALAQTSRSFAATRLVFAFPGTSEVGTLIGAKGAGIRIEAPATGGLAVAPDPVTISFSNEMAPAFFEWLIGAARTNTRGSDVLIVAVDYNNQELYRLALGKARVAEVKWPYLRARSPEVVQFGATLVPETAALTNFKSSTLFQGSQKPKALAAGNYRLGIQGLEQESAQVWSIDSFTQRLMPLPGATSAVVTNDALRLEMPLIAAAAFSKWQAQMLAGAAAERNGVLQFLSSDLKAVGQALLSGLSVRTIDVAPSSAGGLSPSEAGSMVVSLNVRAIELDKASFR